MPLSPFQRSLLPSALVTCATFLTLAMPLAMNRSKVVNLEIQNQPVFSTELRSVAGPYFALSGLFSLAVGTSILGLSGWQQAGKKTESAEDKIADLQRQLLTSQSELEQLKFSEGRLQTQNLMPFLKISAAELKQFGTDDFSRFTSEPAVGVSGLSRDRQLATAPAASRRSQPSLEGLEHGAGLPETAVDSKLEKLLSQLQDLTSEVEKIRQSS